MAGTSQQGSGLGPARPPTGPAVLTAAQAEVLDRLRAHAQPVTAGDLAGDHGSHVNTVRQHLDALVGRGLATRARLPAQGRGRPSYGYLASPVLTDLQAHAVLVDALSEHLADIADDPVTAAETLGRRYSARLGPLVPDTTATGAGLLARLATQMDQLGFSPEFDARPGVARLVTCPLLDVARQHRDVVCGFHRGLAQGLAEADVPPAHRADRPGVALESFAEPGACLLVVREGRHR